MNLRLAAAAFGLLAVSATEGIAQITSNPVDEFVARRGEPASPRRGCAPLRDRPLPALSALGDTAALTRSVADFARRYPMAGDSAPYGLFTLTVGTGGRVESLRPVSYLLPTGHVDDFGRLVAAGLSPAGEAEGTMRLRVEAAEPPRLRLEPAIRCPAEIRGRFEIRTGTPGVPKRQPQPVRVRARVAADGRIVAVHVLRSSGDLEIDSWVQGTLHRSSAIPGLIDGVPTEMDVEEDIRVRLQ